MKTENITLKAHNKCFYERYSKRLARHLKKILKTKNNFGYLKKNLNCYIYAYEGEVTFSLYAYSDSGFYTSNSITHRFLSNLTHSVFQDNFNEKEEILEFLELLKSEANKMFLTKNTCQNCLHRFNYEVMDKCENEYKRRLYK